MNQSSPMKEDDLLERIANMQESGKPLSEEDIDWLTENPDAMQAYKTLLSEKNALMQSNPIDIPDVKQAWEQFERKQKRTTPRFVWGMVTGIAASLLLIFLYSWYTNVRSNANGIVAFHANDEVQRITLQTDNGECIALANNTNDEQLEAFGTILNKQDTLALNYQSQLEKEEIASEAPEQAIAMHRLSTPRGEDFKLILADGTTVWLNTDSYIEYPSRFTGNERLVYLKGEAYFQVAKDAKHPFIIHTDNLDAQVLGTELNIRHYNNNQAHVTLINGSVAVRPKDANSSVILKPGEDAYLLQDGNISVSQVDVDNYIYWKEGYFYFDEVTLEQVMQELGRWYNINVVFDRKEIMNLHVRYFCLRHESIEHAIGLLNRLKNINARISGNTVYIK